MWEICIEKAAVNVGFLTLLFSKLYVKKERLCYKMHASCFGDST